MPYSSDGTENPWSPAPVPYIGTYATRGSSRNLPSMFPVDPSQYSSTQYDPPRTTRNDTTYGGSVLDPEDPFNRQSIPTINRIWTEDGPRVLPPSQRISANLLGRSIDDAFADLRQYHRPRDSARDRTPSLVSDDSRSQGSSRHFPSSPVRAHPYDNSGLEPPVQIVTAREKLPRPHWETAEDSLMARQIPRVQTEYRNTRSPSPAPPRQHKQADVRYPAPKENALLVASTQTMRSSKAPSKVQQEGHFMSDSAANYDATSAPQHGKQKASRSSQRGGPYKCDFCPEVFTRNVDKLRHAKSRHESGPDDKVLLRTHKLFQ